MFNKILIITIFLVLSPAIRAQSGRLPSHPETYHAMLRQQAESQKLLNKDPYRQDYRREPEQLDAEQGLELPAEEDLGKDLETGEPDHLLDVRPDMQSTSALNLVRPDMQSTSALNLAQATEKIASLEQQVTQCNAAAMKILQYNVFHSDAGSKAGFSETRP
jgi:hypothetical protein